MKKNLLALLLAAQPIAAAHAIEPFVVKDIRVEGLQRISAGTVFNYLPVKVGDRLDDNGAKDAIQALFKTGFFKDVRLEQEGAVLVVVVAEQSSVASIDITGNREFDKETLTKAMKQVGFAEGRVFNRAMLDKVEQELKQQYFSRGKYATTIKTTVTPLERNRVGVSIDITEGATATIKQINIVGNDVFRDKDLLKQFSLSPSTLFSFFTKNDQYSKQKLAADLEKLRSFYQDQGYLDFNIDSTQVSITPDKQDIYVTINLTEGKKYSVAEYKLGGKTVVPQAELLTLITFKPGSVFSRKEITKSSKAIADRLANEGYAFANVNAVPEVNKEKQTVAFTFFIDPGRRVYVRRINITGNSVTRDEVIRRELRQLEGAWFSAEDVRRSRIRLQRLGFFEDVNIETPAVPGSTDQVDIEIAVKERPTGSLLFGIGYSDADGMLLQASMSQRNLFGTGKELDVNIDNSAVTQVLSIRYLDPYYTVDGVSRGFNIFRTTVDAAEADTAEYITTTLGGGVSYRVPLSEYRTLDFGLGYEKIDLKTTAETPPEISSFIALNPNNSIFKLTANWSHDTRDSIILPTTGSLHRLGAEVSTPGSDLEYYKLSYLASWYFPVGSDYVLKLGGELGYGDGYGGTVGLPFFKNFFAGGSSTVRGYKSRSLGPRDTGPTPEPLGGSKRILGNMEFIFPVPGASDSKDKRISTFVDAGMVYGPSQSVDFGEMRYSVGVAFNWFSPIGPLSLSYAVPLNKKDGDDVEKFQFTLGRIFR